MKELARQPVKMSRILISKELEETQKLMPISNDDRKSLENSIQKEGVRDPLKVYQEGNNYYLLAGYNRLEIYKKLKGENEEIDVVILEGTKKEFKEFTINDNLERRHFTTEQKDILVNYFIKKNPTLSDRQIGKMAKVDKNTVKKKRKNLIERGDIHHVDKIDSLGRKVGSKPKETEKPLTKKQIETRLNKIDTELASLEKEKEKLKSEKAELTKQLRKLK